jgi:uncharacterized membrane protein
MTQYTQKSETVHPHELEQASNSYLMAVVSVMAGLPLPIINVIASFVFYLGYRKASYFVRWHCVQSILAQAIMIPFNNFAFAWTLNIIFNNVSFSQHMHPASNTWFTEFFYSASPYYWMYIIVIALFNIAEFITVIITAIEVRKGKNMRWFLIANLADTLTNKENRDPYRI